MMEMDAKLQIKSNTEADNQETLRPMIGGGNVKMANLEMHQTMLKQRMQFERDLFRKQMMYGVDLIEEGQGLSAYRVYKKKSLCRRLWDFL